MKFKKFGYRIYKVLRKIFSKSAQFSLHHYLKIIFIVPAVIRRSYRRVNISLKMSHGICVVIMH